MQTIHVQEIYLLIFLLLTKHLICDFFLQFPYQYKHKGIWMHPGGLLHAGIHCVGTFIVILATAFLFHVEPITALGCILLEFPVHYIIDWTKKNINDRKNWGPLTCEYFWWLTGIDQYLHSLTYLVMIIALITFKGF